MPNSSRSRSSAASGALRPTASPIPSQSSEPSTVEPYAARPRGRRHGRATATAAPAVGRPRDRAEPRATGRRARRRTTEPARRVLAMPLQIGRAVFECRLGRVDDDHDASRHRPAGRCRRSTSAGGRRHKGRRVSRQRRVAPRTRQAEVVGRHQSLGDGDFGFRLLGQRDADRVAQAVVEQRADPDRRLDATIFAQRRPRSRPGGAGSRSLPRPCAPPAVGTPRS